MAAAPVPPQQQPELNVLLKGALKFEPNDNNGLEEGGVGGMLHSLLAVGASVWLLLCALQRILTMYRSLPVI